MKGGEQHGEASEEESRLGRCSAQGMGYASRECSQVQAGEKVRVIVPDLRARERARAAGSNKLRKQLSKRKERLCQRKSKMEI